MSSKNLSRRQFMSAAGAAVVLGTSMLDARGGGLRRRGCCPCPVGGDTTPPPPAVRVRPNIASLSEPQLASLKQGIAAMKALPATDPRSWQFQANIHGMLGPATNPLFKQCEHNTLQFFTWHRAYLYYFERILREMSGDPALNLPYWDWTTAPALPEPYRLPAASTNPLFESSRNINDGSALPSNVVVDDLNNAMTSTTFPPSGFVGFSPSLEGSPHGAVHGLVGGLMGSVPTAGNDPIFWLHHCNIDRLWDRWLNLGGGRANPTDAAYLDKMYSFADETGATVTRKVREIISSAVLGYRYDDTPNPPAVAMAMMMVMPPGARSDEKAKPILAASSEKSDRKPAAPPSQPLGFKTERVTLHVDQQHAPALKAAAEPARAKPGKILLQIEGLSIADMPSFTYGVYLNLPEGNVRAESVKTHYVGTVNFFGHDPQSRKDGHGHADATFSETFDVSEIAARLQKAGQWKPESLSVTLRPVTPVPPRGGEEALNKRSEASAAKAKISYTRINVLVTP